MNMNIAPLYTSVHVRQTSPALCWTVTRPTDKSSTPLFMNEHEYRPSIYERPRPTDKSSTPRGGGACTRDTSYIHSLIVVDLQLMHKQDRAHHRGLRFRRRFRQRLWQRRQRRSLAWGSNAAEHRVAPAQLQASRPESQAL